MTSNVLDKYCSLTEALVSNRLFLKTRENLKSPKIGFKLPYFMSQNKISKYHRLYFRHLTKNPFKNHADLEMKNLEVR